MSVPVTINASALSGEVVKLIPRRRKAAASSRTVRLLTRTLECDALSTNSVVEHWAISRPRPITTRSLAVKAISASKWLETRTDLPSAANCFMNCRIQTMPSGSRPFTGSSNIRISGSPNNAPAIPRRCDIPSEYAPARRSATAVRPTCSRTSSTRDGDNRFEAASQRRCDRAERLGCTHFASRSAPTVRNGSFSSRYGLPLISAWPAVGRSSPRIIRMVVDFPDPFGPRKPVTRPGSTMNDS